jgi:hypothetical protein
MQWKTLIAGALIAVVMVGLLAAAQQKADRIIKIDGTSITGQVDSVDETNVIVDGRSIARSDVSAILFAGAQRSSSSSQSGTVRTDLVVKRFGGSSYGHVSQVTGGVVVQNGKALPRSTVASIAFNVSSPGNVITVIPSPSPSPHASPSPTPSPSPGSTQKPEDTGSSDNNDPIPDFDLSGIWVTSEGEEVELTELKSGGGATVFAVFTEHNKLPNGGCKFGDRREKFIDGTLAGKKLTGTMWRCTDSEPLFKGCHVASVYKTTFKANVISKDEIDGYRRTEYWGPGGSGECEFTRDASGDKDAAFRLIRKAVKH